MATGRQDGSTRTALAKSIGRPCPHPQRQVVQAAARYGLPPSLLAATASRDPRRLQLNDEGYSIYGGNEFGLMQVDATPPRQERR